MTTYQIQDWTGKICFGGKTFNSFEEGWDHIYKNDEQPEDDDHYYDDYYVEPVEDGEHFTEFSDEELYADFRDADFLGLSDGGDD